MWEEERREEGRGREREGEGEKGPRPPSTVLGAQGGLVTGGYDYA